MNRNELPSDEDEVQRLLRESHSLGADSSLWLRVMRQLTAHGKPLGQTLAVGVSINDEPLKSLVGMLTFTDQNRLVFWPVLPRTSKIEPVPPLNMVPDHVTVQFPSEKVHLTSYDENGDPVHTPSLGWRSAPVRDPDFRLLFAVHVKLEHVRDQDVLVGRQFIIPPSDVARRTSEISRFRQRIINHDIPVTSSDPNPHYVSFAIYRTESEATAESLPPRLFPGAMFRDMVDNWPDPAEFVAMGKPFKLRDHHLLMAAACPPGQLIDELSFVIPTRQRA